MGDEKGKGLSVVPFFYILSQIIDSVGGIIFCHAIKQGTPRNRRSFYLGCFCEANAWKALPSQILLYFPTQSRLRDPDSQR